MYTNAQKLSAVLAEWMRPAVSQIASSKLMDIPAMKSLQALLCGSGLVGNGYMLQNDLQPIVEPVVNALVQPMLHQYIANVPDESIPQMAKTIAETMLQKGTLSILDGLVTFDREDLCELRDLIEMNLPVETCCEQYTVIH